jgi:hypothetical protein
MLKDYQFYSLDYMRPHVIPLQNLAPKLSDNYQKIKLQRRKAIAIDAMRRLA